MSNMKHLVFLFGAFHAHSDEEKLEAQNMLTTADFAQDQLPFDSHILQKERLLLDSDLDPLTRCRIDEIDFPNWLWYNLDNFDSSASSRRTKIAHGGKVTGRCYEDLEPFTHQCHNGEWIMSRQCSEPEPDNSLCQSLDGHWKDNEGDDCDAYRKRKHCKRFALHNFHRFRNDGHTALSACCGCATDRIRYCKFDDDQIDQLGLEGGKALLQPGKKEYRKCKEGFILINYTRPKLYCPTDASESARAYGCKAIPLCNIRDIDNWQWYNFDKVDGQSITRWTRIAHGGKVTGHCLKDNRRFTMKCLSGDSQFGTIHGWNNAVFCDKPNAYDLSSETGLTNQAKQKLEHHEDAYLTYSYQPLCKSGYEESPEISQFESKYAGLRYRGVICLGGKFYAWAGLRTKHIQQEVGKLCVEVPDCDETRVSFGKPHRYDLTGPWTETQEKDVDCTEQGKWSRHVQPISFTRVRCNGGVLELVDPNRQCPPLKCKADTPGAVLGLNPAFSIDEGHSKDTDQICLQQQVPGSMECVWTGSALQLKWKDTPGQCKDSKVSPP